MSHPVDVLSSFPPPHFKVSEVSVLGARIRPTGKEKVMDARRGTRATQEREAREVHPLWQHLGTLDGWISRRISGLLQWISTRSTAVLKLIWVPICLVFGPLAALLSSVLMVMAVLACLLSLLIVLSRFFRGQPLKTWAGVAVAFFLGSRTFSGDVGDSLQSPGI
jgi:hypothetical protein